MEKGAVSKMFSLEIGPVLCPELGEDQKKPSLRLGLVFGTDFSSSPWPK